MILRKIYILILLLTFLISSGISCSKKRMYKDATDIYNKMSLEQKIGQMLIVAIPGNSMDYKAESIIKKYLPGGVILFGYNLSSGSNLQQFIIDLQTASMKYSGVPLFISIDQEGGRVKRIIDGVTQFPGNMAAGIAGDKKLVYKWGRVLGIQLRLLGVNMNFAPVLDVNNNPENPVINLRSFGSDPVLVSEMGKHYIKGIQQSWCIAVGKHFPGHGDTNRDSHITLPVIPYEMERLRKIEFPPFINAIEEGVEGIMTAHIAFPNILKNNNPATTSKKFLTDILRKEMGFKGIIITDDLEMNAISKNMDIGQAAVNSINAGADIILNTSYGRNIKVIYNSIKSAVKNEKISVNRINESLKRIIELKLRYNIMHHNDGHIRPGRVIPGPEEREILKEADRINNKMSREAIYYYGKGRLRTSKYDTVRIFITSNNILRDIIKRKDNDLFFHDTNKFLKYNMKKGTGDRFVLYYHIIKPDIKLLKKIQRYCNNRKIELVVLSSGNPFPITGAGIVESVLYSFSDTDESLKQLGKCLNGDFNPGKKINFYPGLESKNRKK